MSEHGVSVLIPVNEFNNFFLRCLNSLKMVSSHKLEIVCVIDEEWEDFKFAQSRAILASSIHALSFVQNMQPGLSNALNTGILACTNELICRLDADDEILCERISLQVNYLSLNPNVAAVGGQVEFIDELGNLIPYLSHSYPIGRQNVEAGLKSECCLSHPTVMFRKSSILTIGGYSPNFLAAEDYDLWLRLIEIFHIDNLPNTVIRYRIHALQSSAAKEKVFFYSLVARLLSINRSYGPVFPNRNLGDLANWVEDTSLELLCTQEFCLQYFNLSIIYLRDMQFAKAIESLYTAFSESFLFTTKILVKRLRFWLLRVFHFN
jgi:glycosyltransferase involved in cell wall biosynthesis